MPIWSGPVGMRIVSWPCPARTARFFGWRRWRKTPARPDADKPQGSGQAGADRATTSVLAAPPVFAGDLNADGVPDLVATAADPSSESGGVRRWVEALSGRTGETLWSSEIADRWFTLPSGEEAPEDYRDYGPGPTGMQGRGGGWSQEGDIVRRSRGRTTTTGPHVYMPSGACRVSVRRIGGPTGETVLALIAGQLVLTLAPQNGQPRGSPIDCGFRPGLSPLAADVDGDGSDEFVLLEELPAQASWAGPSGAPRTRLGVVSLVQRRMLWSRVIQAAWPGPETNTSPVPRWPVIADLEGDGRAELLVPNGTSEASGGWEPSAWGELEIVDGRTGKPALETQAEDDGFAGGPFPGGPRCGRRRCAGRLCGHAVGDALRLVHRRPVGLRWPNVVDGAAAVEADAVRQRIPPCAAALVASGQRRLAADGRAGFR